MCGSAIEHWNWVLNENSKTNENKNNRLKIYTIPLYSLYIIYLQFNEFCVATNVSIENSPLYYFTIVFNVHYYIILFKLVCMFV